MNNLSKLRKKAEFLNNNSKSYNLEPELETATIEQLKALTHELKVHQIELELQNEELQEIQISLLHAKEQYQELFELAPIGYITLDINGSIQEVNNTACNLLAMEKAKLSRQSIYFFIEKDYKAAFANHLRSVIKHKNKRQDEIKIRRSDGFTYYALVESTIAQTSLSIEPHIRLVLTDIDELYKMRQAAEAANKAKSIFLTNISHELRTPMHGVLGFAFLGIKKLKNSDACKVKTYFENISISAQRLLLLLEDLLDLSKLEAGKMELKISEQNIQTIIECCHSEMAAKLEERKLNVIFSKPNFPILVYCDKLRIEQVILNLLSNAIKFSPEGGTITFNLAVLEHKKVKISVIDQGKGIEPDRQTHIFNKFIQDDSDNTGAGLGSTGLGLAISKEIIDLHQEKIWAESSKDGNRGGILSFTLPQK